MLRTTSPRPSRFRLALATAGLVALIVIGALVAMRPPANVERGVAADIGAPPSAPSVGPATVSRAQSFGDRVALQPVISSADPTTFAGNVARAIFEWDTTAGHELGDYRGRLLIVADPTGHESPGLVADLATYLPAATTWAHLAEYSTRQWLDVTEIVEPDQWAQALAQAPAGSVVPGTTALTVSGVRQRAGIWDGEDVATEFDVAFTAFIVCEPTYPTCHLLRLSQLDNPLR